MTRRVVVNVLTNWAAFIAATAITFVLSPFVVHALGDARYGVWGVVSSIVGYLGLLDLGLRVTVTRYVARHHAMGEPQAVNRVMTVAIGLFAVAGAIAVVLGTQLALLLPRILAIPSELAREATLSLAIAGATVAATLLGGVFGGSLAGRQRFAALNFIDLGVEIARALAIVAALRAGGGLIELSLLQLASVTARGLLYLVAYQRLEPGFRVSPSLWDTATMREILRFSSYTLILHVSAMVIFSSDALVIAALMPVTQVTFFVIAGSLGQAALQVLGGISRALYPVVSAAQATASTREAGGLVMNSVRLGTLVVLPIVITFLVRGVTFIGLWMGPPYAVPSGEVLQILAIGLCVFVSYHIFGSHIMALNLHRGLVVPFVFEAAANIVLSVLLGYFMGLPGVAWGTTLPRAVVALGFAPWFARRELDISLREYASHAWVRPLAAMMPFALVSFIIDRAWPVPNLLAFFLQVAIALPVAAVGVWVIGLTRGERTRVRAGLEGVWIRARYVPGVADAQPAAAITGSTSDEA